MAKDRTTVALHSPTGMTPHDFDADPLAPGCCCAAAPEIGRVCRLLKSNALHDQAAIIAYRKERAGIDEAQAESRRRTGDT